MSTLSYTDFSKANGCLKLHNINTKLTILEGLLKFQRLRTNVIQQEMILRLLLVSCWKEKRAQIYISEHLLDVTTAKEKLWYNRAKKWLLISWWFHLRVNKRTPYIGSQRNKHMVLFMHDWLWQYRCGLILRVVALNCAWKSLYLPPTQQSHLVSAFPYHTACCYTARCITQLNS